MQYVGWAQVGVAAVVVAVAVGNKAVAQRGKMAAVRKKRLKATVGENSGPAGCSWVGKRIAVVLMLLGTAVAGQRTALEVEQRSAESSKLVAEAVIDQPDPID